MHRQNFERDAHRLSLITLPMLQQVQHEEENHLPLSDPTIRLLRKHVYGSSGHVMGSDQSRYQLRSQICSTSIMLNPPTLWITINPSDLHDPIVQVFAGEQIDLDNLFGVVGPDSDRQAANIAGDPYAAVKFFHFLI